MSCNAGNVFGARTERVSFVHDQGYSDAHAFYLSIGYDGAPACHDQSFERDPR